MLNRLRATKFFAFLITVAVTVAAHAVSSSLADLPNLYVPKADWNLRPADIPREHIEVSREKINKALYSLLSRATMTVFLPGQPQPQQVQIFHLLSEKAGDHALRPLIRSLIGYLYNDLHKAWSENPDTFDGWKALDQIAQAKEPLPISQLWGVGSDFDILIAGRDTDNIAFELTTLLNSVRTHYKIKFSKEGDNRALYPLGDVKSYEKQIERSTSQGGSTVDFLSFDLRSRELIEPANLPGTIDNLIRGERSYAESKIQKENSEIQVSLVRGMRPESELPWLVLDKQSAVTYEKDLNQVQKIEAPKAIEQLQKAIRNSRLSAGNNHLLHSPAGSPQGRFISLVEASNLKFPEFLENYALPPHGRASTLPDSAFMSPEEFMRGLPDGRVYHGSSKQAYIAILRSNFLVSGTKNNYQQTFGRGVYVTPSKAVAETYMRGHGQGDGVIIPLSVRRDRPVRILDLTQPSTKSMYEGLLSRVAQGDKDLLHVILARDYGVDVLKADEKETVILNAEAIEIPSITVIVDVKLQDLRNSALSDFERLQNLGEIYSLATYLSQTNLKKAEDVQIECHELAEKNFDLAFHLQSSDPTRSASIFGSLAGYYFSPNLNDPIVKQLLLTGIKKGTLDNLAALSGFIFSQANIEQHADIARALIERLSDVKLIDEANRRGGMAIAYRNLIDLAFKSPLSAETVPAIRQLIGNPDKGIKMRLAQNFFGDERSLPYNADLSRFIEGADRDDLMHLAWYAFSMPDLKGRQVLLSKVISKNDSQVNSTLVDYCFNKAVKTDLSRYAAEFVKVGDYAAASLLKRNLNPNLPWARVVLEGSSLSSQTERVAFFEKHGLLGGPAAALNTQVTTIQPARSAELSNNKLILSEVAALVQNGVPDSLRVTELLDSLPAHLSDEDLTVLRNIRSVFDQIKTPIRGYSYVSRNFEKILGSSRCELVLKRSVLN